MTERIVGIVPAGGRARRIYGFFKELMPIGMDEHDRAKFIVSGEQIIDKIIAAGAQAVHLIISRHKSFVAEYFSVNNKFNGRLNVNYVGEDLETAGMPYTLDSQYYQVREYDTVIMGLPDTIIEPADAFTRILHILRYNKADIAIGVFATDYRNKGGWIEFDRVTKIVTGHFDHASPKFPRNPDNAWAVVAWNKKFTEFMHAELGKKSALLKTTPMNKEIIFGYMIDIAIKNDTIKIVADYIDERDGFFWDITSLEKYFELLRYYYPIDGASRRFLKAGQEPMPSCKSDKKIFIGHGRSLMWRELKDFIKDSLGLLYDEFNRVPVAGSTNVERLSEMLNGAAIAFIVLTAEDEQHDGTLRARQNVIHEVGLFQGRLGFSKSIILLEEKCEAFSNIDGLGQIRFPAGKISSVFEEVRRVLIREKIIDGSKVS